MKKVLAGAALMAAGLVSFDAAATDISCTTQTFPAQLDCQSNSGVRNQGRAGVGFRRNDTDSGWIASINLRIGEFAQLIVRDARGNLIFGPMEDRVADNTSQRFAIPDSAGNRIRSVQLFVRDVRIRLRGTTGVVRCNGCTIPVINLDDPSASIGGRLTLQGFYSDGLREFAEFVQIVSQGKTTVSVSPRGVAVHNFIPNFGTIPITHSLCGNEATASCLSFNSAELTAPTEFLPLAIAGGSFFAPQ